MEEWGETKRRGGQKEDIDKKESKRVQSKSEERPRR